MLDRKLAPVFVKTNSLLLSKPTVINIEADVNLFLFSDVKQNACKIELILQAGKWFEPKVGVSYFTAHLLEKGTTTKHALQIAETLDYYGAHLEINPGYDFVSISLVALKSHLPHLLPLLQELLLNPSFPEGEWRLMKEIFLQNLRVTNEKTSALASKAIRKSVFGEQHPYGTSVEESTIENLTLADFKSFYHSHFNLSHIFVCGNLNIEETNFISSAFKSLVKPTQKNNAVINENNTPTELHIAKESIQSSIRLAKKCVLKAHPDYIGILLLNHLLGGFFGSRLMKNIREEKGLTYGIHSSIYSFQREGMMVIEADVNKSNLPLALVEIKSEITRLSQELISEEELTLARNHFIGGLQNELANPFSVADKIKNVKLNNLDQDFYQSLIQKMNSFNSEQLQSLSTNYFQPESFMQVTVG